MEQSNKNKQDSNQGQNIPPSLDEREFSWWPLFRAFFLSGISVATMFLIAKYVFGLKI